MRMPFRLNPHRSRTLPAVSFFEGFQTPAGLEKTRAHLCVRHLKPITKPDVHVVSRSNAGQGGFQIQKRFFSEKSNTIPYVTHIGTSLTMHVPISSKSCPPARRGRGRQLLQPA